MKKGFTLVEMIAVITLLAVIALIVIPNMVSIIDKQKDKLYNKQVEEINNAVELYLSRETPTGDNIVLSLSTLKTKGYLKNEDIIDPRDKSVIDGDFLLTWDSDNNRYDYNFYQGGY